MICGVYSLRDCKSVYMHPVLYVDDSSALRDLSYSLSEDNDALDYLKANPSDFVFYRVGYFDTETGVLTATDPVKLVDLASLMKGG